MLHLDYRDGRPIYAQIVDGVKDQITSGILRWGDKLPSVRELAAELAINPNTIQRSYRTLEAQGWIVTVPGKGCFVSENTEKIQQEKLRWFAALSEAAAALETLGVTRQEMAAYLTKGGNTNASND